MADRSTIKFLKNLFGFSQNRPSGMHTDQPISMQPEGTYRSAWGVTTGTTEAKGGGLFSMNGQDKCAVLPEGAMERGHHFLEESDRHVYFLNNGGKSEIGYVDAKTCKYHKVIDDDDITDCDLEFGENEWIPIVSKTMRNGTCHEVHLYWTNGTYYKKVNIDNPFYNCPLEKLTCKDVLLLRCHNGPTPVVYASETGGRDLEGGVRQYVCQFEDDDANVTNYFQIGDPVAIETPNNVVGERSRQAVHVKLNNLSPDYNKVNIACIRTVGGNETVTVVAKLYYTTDGIEFVHRSESQYEYDLDGGIEEIRSKKNGYFRGLDIFQYDRQLMPFNLLGEKNEDWQQIIDDIDVGYRIVGVPMEYAHLVKGLRADEVYGVGVIGNYCDGTRTRTFHKKGREATAFDRALVSGDDNCLECEVERWQVENTAVRTEVICDDPRELGDDEEIVLYDTGDPTYEPTDPCPEVLDDNGDLVRQEDCDDELNDDDGSGVPDADDFKEIGNASLRQQECVCDRLARLFKLFKKKSGHGFRDTAVSPPMWRHVLSDPVSIANAWCACDELAKQGGADDDPIQSERCECCSLCSNPETATDCNCCDDCEEGTPPINTGDQN